jgi:hypothetical protein
MLSKQEEERKVREAEHARLLREGTTFHQRAQAFADEINQGRFAAIGSPTVVGAQPVPQYPAASPSWQIQLPDEPPLGFENPAIEGPSAGSLLPAEQTGAPAGAAAAVERLPPGSAQSDDAGASFSKDRDNG